MSAANLACSCLACAAPTSLLFCAKVATSRACSARRRLQNGWCGPAWSLLKPNPAVSAAPTLQLPETWGNASHRCQSLAPHGKVSGEPHLLWLGAPTASQLALLDRWLLARAHARRPAQSCPASVLAADVLADLTKAEPGAPSNSGSPVCAQRGSSSSDEAAAPAVEAHLSEASPLLSQGAGLSALSLRRRPGHSEAPS